MDYFAMLRAFTRSSQLGSLSKAAEEQAAKVSTISRYVSALEDDVGAALFNRSTRRLQLTEAGGALFERAVHILDELDSARGSIRELNSRPQGLLRANVPGAFGRRQLMPHVPIFLKRYPDIRLDLTMDNRTVDRIRHEQPTRFCRDVSQAAAFGVLVWGRAHRHDACAQRVLRLVSGCA